MGLDLGRFGFRGRGVWGQGLGLGLGFGVWVEGSGLGSRVRTRLQGLGLNAQGYQPPSVESMSQGHKTTTPVGAESMPKGHEQKNKTLMGCKCKKVTKHWPPRRRHCQMVTKKTGPVGWGQCQKVTKTQPPWEESGNQCQIVMNSQPVREVNATRLRKISPRMGGESMQKTY